MTNCFFLLGGADREMTEIGQVILAKNQPFMSLGLGWGAKASAYQEFFKTLTDQGFTLVAIELEEDTDLPEGTVIINHHDGAHAGKPASILQVLEIFGMQPTADQQILAEVDNGGGPKVLRSIGFTPDQIRTWAAGDTAVSDDQAQEIDRAWEAREVTGALTVVRMSHSKAVALCFRVAGEYQSLIVISGDGEVNFFDNSDVIRALNEKFGGWSNIAADEQTGYWGKNKMSPDEQEEILRFVQATLEKK